MNPDERKSPPDAPPQDPTRPKPPARPSRRRRRLGRLAVILAGSLLLLALIGAGGCATVLSIGADFAQWRFPGAVYQMNVSSRTIALTIDDAPCAASTGAILDALRDNGATATFFLISARIEGPEAEALVRRILDEGHEIGHHMTKDEKSVRLGERFLAEFDKAEVVFRRFDRPRWFRPGDGFYNQAMLDHAESKGYRCVLGSVWPVDTWITWSGFHSWFIARGVRPGAIVILHDGGKSGARGRRTARTLRRVLPRLERRGYSVVSLSGLEAEQR